MELCALHNADFHDCMEAAITTLCDNLLYDVGGLLIITGMTLCSLILYGLSLSYTHFINLTATCQGFLTGLEFHEPKVETKTNITREGKVCSILQY